MKKKQLSKEPTRDPELMNIERSSTTQLFDSKDYRKYLDELDCSDEEKDALLRTLWARMSHLVDKAWNGSVSHTSSPAAGERIPEAEVNRASTSNNFAARLGDEQVNTLP
jgi:hypothetical protein